MKRLLLSLLLVAACAAPKPTVAKRDVATVSRAFHYTVALQNGLGDTFCSGVIVDHKVLTAAHCVAAGTPVFVATDSGRWEAALFSDDPISDLALLLPADGHELPKGVRLAREAPHWGDDVWVIGHALGEFDYSVTKGVVSHPYRLTAGQVWFQHDAGTIGGNSGGPVLNKHGRLVGITSFGILDGLVCAFGCPGAFQRTHINGAVHLTPIRNLLS